MTQRTRSLAELLRTQDHYYLLHDGTNYARHGTAGSNGLLVFETREGADQFHQTVGKALPAFQPIRVEAEEFLRLCDEVGAVCMAEGLKVVVATLTPQGWEPVNPEGVVTDDSNWEPAKKR
jgi:hypothetical protein